MKYALSVGFGINTNGILYLCIMYHITGSIITIIMINLTNELTNKQHYSISDKA